MIEGSIKPIDKVAAPQSAANYRLFRHHVCKAKAGSEVVISGSHIGVLGNRAQLGQD